MNKYPMCRICLVKDVPMHALINKNLHELYEKLTNKPFVTEDSTPNLVCNFCCAKLKQSFHIVKKCLGAKERFAQMTDENYKPQPLLNNGHLDVSRRFIRSAIQVISIDEKPPKETVVIKVELSEICDEIIEPKKEILSDDDLEKYEEDVLPHTESHSDGDVPVLKLKCEVEDKLEVSGNEVRAVDPSNLESANIYNIYPDVEDSGSDSEDVPLMMFKAEKTVEEEIEVSKNKRTSVETRRATVAKKPKLSARRTKQEDTITAGLETNEQSNVKVITASQNCTTKRGSDLKESYECNVCNRSFRRKNSLTRHTRIHTGEKPHKCNVCHCRFRDKYSLTVHVRKHTGDKLHKCDICPSSFIQKADLAKHARTHTGEKPHKCDLCQKSFRAKASLIAHVRIHTGEKPFKCDMCPSSFNQKFVLTRHTRTHTGERPYICHICDRSFIVTTHLKSHILTHTGEKPHKCDLCQKSFRAKASLIAHVRIHTGERPFKCDMCPLSFTKNNFLTRHARTHTGEKPYTCHICDRSFRETTHLKNHILTHTRVKPYKCDLCQQRFTRKNALTNHLNTHK